MLVIASLVGVRGAASSLAVWAVFAALIVLAMAAKKRSLALGALSVVAWVVLGASIVHAFVRGPREAR